MKKKYTFCFFVHTDIIFLRVLSISSLFLVSPSWFLNASLLRRQYVQIEHFPFSVIYTSTSSGINNYI